MAMVACYRNRSTCRWHAYDPARLNNRVPATDRNMHTINYDIRLVNGNPNQSASHPLTFQFSFDQQNLLEMYLIFLLVYLVLIPMQIYAVRLQKHPVTKLFTISLISEFVSLAFITTHLIYFALNGIGQPDVEAAGDILDIFSRVSVIGRLNLI